MKKERFVIALLSCIGISILLIVGDLFDVFSKIGINVPELNMDFISLVVTNAIVVILFIVAYHYVDKRSIKAMENKRELGLHLLKKTCDSCEAMDNSLSVEIIKQFVVPKVDFNATKNDLVDNLRNAPFSFDEQIMGLFSDGTLTKDEFDLYIELKSAYGIAINTRITFFDAPRVQESADKNYQKALKDLQSFLIIQTKGKK